VQIAGEIFDPAGGQPEMIGAISTLSAIDPGLAPDEYLVQVKPGADIGSYVNALSSALGKGYLVSVNDRGGAVLPAIEGLVGTLTLVIALVAGLGVLNTVVLQTRERVHDLGVFKAVGMTPRQTITMVVSTVAGTGLASIPAGSPCSGACCRSWAMPCRPPCRSRCSTCTRRRSWSCSRCRDWPSRRQARSPRPAGRPAPAPPPRCAPSSAPVPGPAGRSGYRGEVGQRIFAAGVHSGIAGSKHQ
jgi:hypothetical protein